MLPKMWPDNLICQFKEIFKNVIQTGQYLEKVLSFEMKSPQGNTETQ